MAITPKRQRFVEEYLVDLNATQAAIRAGYSPRTANREGARLLSNAVIAEAISERQKRREERTEVTQDMVVEGLLVEAKLTGEGSSHSARVAAWTQLGKHLGMFRERVEHSGATTQTVIYLPAKDAPPG